MKLTALDKSYHSLKELAQQYSVVVEKLQENCLLEKQSL